MLRLFPAHCVSRDVNPFGRRPLELESETRTQNDTEMSGDESSKKQVSQRRARPCICACITVGTHTHTRTYITVGMPFPGDTQKHITTFFNSYPFDHRARPMFRLVLKSAIAVYAPEGQSVTLTRPDLRKVRLISRCHNKNL